ncbi:hypothetical protein [Methanococcoides methylutens]|uniref:DUF7490 domain-containing protein n=1 Tax=Methanococcoides methylutens MM1 TaxID=1434104 RepID=A0A0E3X032_METMT|nr:hypothetical protein [Methanococcoides methylutens]AKB85394.1 hypothetical protein MCMEM_1341 [Methanococcoides methylutens MM1]
MSTPQEEGALLTVTPYIRNDQSSDSSMLSIKIKVIDQTTQLIVAEKDLDMGYVKAESMAYNSASLEVPEAGKYVVEVQLFEDDRLLEEMGTFVTVKEKPSADQPANIKLTDMNLVITKFVNSDREAVVDVSPGVYNEGGDSRSLNMIVTARVDPYTAYTESDELGILKGSSRVRGNVRFVLQRNDDYTFTVVVEENGREVAISENPAPVKLDEIYKIDVVNTYPLVEEGTPIVEEPTDEPVEEPDEDAMPGFQVLLTLTAILLTAGIVNRGILSSKKQRK